MAKSRRIVPPNARLKWSLDALGISIAAFAVHIGYSYRGLYNFLKGTTKVSYDLALRLEKALGISAEEWMRLQAEWDLFDLRNMYPEKYDDISRINTKADLKEVYRQAKAPGAVIAQSLARNRIDPAEFAQDVGLTTEELGKIIAGDVYPDRRQGMRISKRLKQPTIWMHNLVRAYRQAVSRARKKPPHKD